MKIVVLSLYRVSHNRLPGCRGQPFGPVGQPKVDPWLPDRATKGFALCLYVYDVGQPKWLVGQPRFETGCPTGQPAFKMNVKHCYIFLYGGISEACVNKTTNFIEPIMLVFMALCKSLFIFGIIARISLKCVKRNVYANWDGNFTLELQKAKKGQNHVLWWALKKKTFLTAIYVKLYSSYMCL